MTKGKPLAPMVKLNRIACNLVQSPHTTLDIFAMDVDFAFEVGTGIATTQDAGCTVPLVKS